MLKSEFAIDITIEELNALYNKCGIISVINNGEITNVELEEA